MKLKDIRLLRNRDSIRNEVLNLIERGIIKKYVASEEELVPYKEEKNDE